MFLRNPTRLLGLATAIALIVTAAPLAAADRLHAGEWEFTTSHGKEAANTMKHCITAEEASSVNGDTKTARAYAEKQAKNCTIQDYKVSGDSVTYAMTCGTTSIRSTSTFHLDSMEGDVTSSRDGGPEVVTHVRARRLGDCH